MPIHDSAESVAEPIVGRVSNAIEGAREIEINGDLQMEVLTGVVRPVDIGKDNVVLSPSIGQLRIRYFGRGLIKDNLKPGWLIRAMNKIF